MEPRTRNIVLVSGAAVVLIGLVVVIYLLRLRSSAELQLDNQPLTQPAVTVPAATEQPAATSTVSLPPDNDQDGLTNDQEKQYGTDADNPDTDGDGYTDFEEVVINKTDPLKTNPPPTRRALPAPESSTSTPTSTSVNAKPAKLGAGSR